LQKVNGIDTKQDGQISGLTKDLTSDTDRISALEASSKKNSASIGGLEASVKKAQSTADKGVEATSSILKQLETVETKLKSLEAKGGAHDSAIQANKQGVSDLTAKVTAVETKASANSAAIETLKTDVTTLKTPAAAPAAPAAPA